MRTTELLQWSHWLLILVALAGYGPAARAFSPAATGSISTLDANYRCDQPHARSNRITTIRTILAGVPAILRVPPAAERRPIILWHGFGPPEDPQALMRALPLDDVPAIKVYLELPLFGKRAPPGGRDELVRRQKTDFAKLLFKPSVVGGADELPRVVAALRKRGCLKPREPVDLMGFSAGGAAVLIALIQGKVSVGSAAIVNASTGLNASVNALERATGHPYAWTPDSRALAGETDAQHHAADIARGAPPVALLILQGESDSVLGPEPAIGLHSALLPYYRKRHDEARLSLMLIPEMPHSWATAGNAATQVNRAIGNWFETHD